MAKIGTLSLTLNDWARRNDPDGSIAIIVEILHLMNPILDDMRFMEGNLPTGHKTTIRSGLPATTWRMLYQGVQPSKSRTIQVTDAIGMLEAYAEVDKSIADLNGNTAAFRFSEDTAFIEAMGQNLASTLIYGNTGIDPERFLGFEPRYNDLNAENGANILDAGGAGVDNTSIWLITWGDSTSHGIFPKGQVTGLQHTDLGEVTLQDAANRNFQGYRTHYKWDVGLVVRDWRYTVRIANIDVSDLKKDAATGADLIDLMAQALEQIQSLNIGTPIFYCNRTIKSFLRRQISNKSNVNLTLDTAGGVHTLAFDGIPVKLIESIVETEQRVIGL